MRRIIEKTADGSSTLYIPEIDEHYHSVKGAETEALHIFINMGLKAAKIVDNVRIFEVGFGTGLNAYLTLCETRKSRRYIHYTSIELFPLPWDIVNELHYTDDPVLQTLHNAPWNTDVEIIPGFVLHKIQADLTGYEFPDEKGFDVVYFDAFAPEKQPAMWQPEVFERLYQQMNPEGLLTTYCAKGIVRRTMQQAGFTVERLPGPPGGKREILRARK